MTYPADGRKRQKAARRKAAGVGGEISVNPARIDQHGKEIKSAVRPALDKARST